MTNAGFRLAIHPDSAAKILTMMIYFPTPEEAEDVKFAYGTNVHTEKQFKAGNTDNFFSRYLFLPNSAYAMKISRTSYHSVSTLPQGPVRKTLVLNWYHTSTRRSKRKKREGKSY